MPTERPRRIMRVFKINEISVVDEPAQTGARISIMKRATVEKDGMGPCDDLEPDMLDPEELDAADAGGDNTTTDSSQETDMTPEEKIAQLETELKAANAKLAELAPAKAADPAPNPDAEGDAADAEKAAKSADPVVAKMASELSKMRSEREEDRKALREEIGKRKTMELAKRVSTELGHLPGDEAHKIALLAAVDGIGDESVRKGVTAILRANDSGIAEALKKRGTTGAGAESPSEPEAKLDTMAKKIASDEKIPYSKAYSKALETAEGKTLYGQMSAPIQQAQA